MTNRFKTIRKSLGRSAVVRDALTGAAEAGSGKKYPVLMSAMELVGDQNPGELEYLKETIKDRFGKIVISDSGIETRNDFYEMPLIKVYFTDEIKKGKFFNLLTCSAKDLCVEFKVFRITVKRFVEEKFGGKFTGAGGKEDSQHLFSVGGIWDLKGLVWHLRPNVGEEEFWK